MEPSKEKIVDNKVGSIFKYFIRHIDNIMVI